MFSFNCQAHLCLGMYLTDLGISYIMSSVVKTLFQALVGWE